ncbi:TPA: phage tail protein [Enterobacter cancerogenus]|nr:phage tail protein [Enterobacter cancerogenus]HDR2167392.1 phage tail protein [Enterobacter cancerogenus]HDR2270006.1 phage tail protein [Enterobacter cancerogenus]
MATQPTTLPVPSESPRDLKFNAGKIDEFVTSMGSTYTDRFEQKHYTIEGINYLSQQAMAAYGYVILTGKTFTTGATISNPNEVLLNTADGEYYKWTGSFASGGKVVPANSEPGSTGGIGPGAWIGVGDSSLRSSLASDNDGDGDELVAVKQPYTGAIARTQHQKNAEFISVTDFGAVGDGVTDDTGAFQKAINAAYRSGGKGAYVYVPPKDNYYKVSNLQITSAITFFSAGKYGATLKTDVGSTVVVKARFTEIIGVNFIGGGKNTGNSSGVVINEALIKMADCSFSFYDVCYYAPEKKSSAELCVQNNRFASSKYGVFLGGGQINSHFFNNTYSDCNTMIHVSEILTDGVQSTTEGLVFTQELGYDCGNDSLGMKAVEVVGTRWTWFDHCMVDLSHDVALSLTDAKDVKLTGGYYSSNNSTGSPCLLIEGASWNFLAQGTCFSDSRSYGVSVTKKSTDIPKNCRFIGVTFQNNDIDPAQSGDIIINSVPDVSLNNCNLLSNKSSSISVIDNLAGGSSAFLNGCSITGGAFVAAGCKLKNINSPTHPEQQVGILTLPGGGNSISTPLTIKPLQSGVAIAVLATPASGGDIINAGVQGNNIVINRTTSPAGSTAVSFQAFTIS